MRNIMVESIHPTQFGFSGLRFVFSGVSETLYLARHSLSFGSVS